MFTSRMVLMLISAFIVVAVSIQASEKGAGNAKALSNIEQIPQLAASTNVQSIANDRGGSPIQIGTTGHMRFNAVDPKRGLSSYGYTTSSNDLKRALAAGFPTSILALRVIGDEHLQSMAGDVRMQLADKSTWVRVEAGITLAKLGEDLGKDFLIKEVGLCYGSLKSRDKSNAVKLDYVDISSAIQAARALADLGNPEGFDCITEIILAYQTNSFARSASRLLPKFVKIEKVRSKTYAFLSRVIDEQIEQLASSTVADKEPARQACKRMLASYLETLSGMQDEASYGKLAELSRHSNPEVRSIARTWKKTRDGKAHKKSTGSSPESSTDGILSSQPK